MFTPCEREFLLGLLLGVMMMLLVWAWAEPQDHPA